MPYIKQQDRNRIDGPLSALAEQIHTVGELNYAITRLSLRLLRELGLNYSNISNVVGTLSLIPVEIGRRLINSYEDTKIKQNGDVSEFKESGLPARGINETKEVGDSSSENDAALLHALSYNIGYFGYNSGQLLGAKYAVALLKEARETILQRSNRR